MFVKHICINLYGNVQILHICIEYYAHIHKKIYIIPFVHIHILINKSEHQIPFLSHTQMLYKFPCMKYI